MIGCGAIRCLLGTSLFNWESESLLVMIRELLAMGTKGSVGFGGALGLGLRFWLAGAKAHTCGLGGRTQHRAHSLPVTLLPSASGDELPILCFRDLG